MIKARFYSVGRLLIAAAAFTVLAFSVTSAPPVSATGLRTCADVSGRVGRRSH